MSHLAWADALPRRWDAKPLRAVADYVVSSVDKVPVEGEMPVRLCNYTDVYKNESITQDLDFMLGTATASELRKFRLAVNDVIITKDSESWDDIGVPALVRETAEDLVCGYHLAVLRPRASSLDGRFLFRCLQTHGIRVQLELSANGVTRFGIPQAAIGTIVLPVPPLPTQRAIADFLDRETGRLDALVAAKTRVLALLAEKRRVQIARAILHGLDRGIRLVDSGIPGMGAIPMHWRCVRVRFLIDRIEQGWSPEVDSWAPSDDEWGVLKLNAVSRGKFDATAAKAMPAGLDPEEDLEVRPGDFLVTRANTPGLVGDACYVEATRPHLMLCDLIYRLSLRKDMIDGRFLCYFLTLPEGRCQIEVDGRGTSGSMVKISQEHIRDWWVPLPPVEEQASIVAHVRRLTAELDRLRDATMRSVALIRERRAALISAAVMGALPIA